MNFSLYILKYRSLGFPKKFIFASIFFVLVFGSLELACRFKYNPISRSKKNCFEYDSNKIYRLKKSFTGTYAEVPLQTNSFGHRDSEIPLKKPLNEIRVIVVGDSVSFGHGIKGSQVYSEVLEKRLSREFPQHSFQVINTAVPGYSPFQEYYDLQRAFDFHPDAVVLQFSLNDVVQPYWLYRRYGASGKENLVIPDVPYLDYVLTQKSSIYIALKELANRVLHGPIPRDKPRQNSSQRELYSMEKLLEQPDNPRIREAWKEYFYWTQKSVNLAKNNKISIIFLSVPARAQILENTIRDYPQKKLEQFSVRNDITHVDFLTLMKPNPHLSWNDLFRDPHHPNATGHALIADRLFEIIKVEFGLR